MSKDYHYWNEQRELATPDELKDIQLRELQGMLQRVYDKVQFYHQKFDEMGITPDDMKELGDLPKFPLTKKTDLRDNYPYGLFATPLDEIIRIHASSGTTGKPIVVGYTRHDIEDVWTEVMARSCVSSGMHQGDVVQNAYGYGLFTGGLGFHYGAERIGATVVPISAGATERQLMIMEDFGTTVLVCTPSYAVYLGEKMEQMGVRGNMKIRMGVFGAEPWSENMRQKIEEKLSIDAMDVYGLTEITGPGVSIDCLEKNGLHIWSDHFYPEIVDKDTKEPVAEGEQGDLVFTTMTKEGIPMCRYDTKDIASLNYEKCACGRWHPRHSKIVARSDDMLKIRGVIVFPSEIESVLLKIPGVGEYYEIIVDRDILDNLKVRIELTPEAFSDEVKDLENFKNHIEKELFTILQVQCDVELVPPGTIVRSEGKAKRVIDLRKEI